MVIFVGDRNARICQYKAGINLHPGTVPHLSCCPVTVYYLRGRRLPGLSFCLTLEDLQGKGPRRESVKASIRWQLCAANDWRLGKCSGEAPHLVAISYVLALFSCIPYTAPPLALAQGQNRAKLDLWNDPR